MRTRIAISLFVLSLAAPSLEAAPIARKIDSPDKGASIEKQCDSEMEQECLVLWVNRGRKTKIIEKVRAPTIKWHTNNLAEIFVSCGSPCNHSWFYSVEDGVSPPIEFVLAVSPTKKYAVRAGLDALEVVPIFGDIKKPVQIIERDFMPTAALVFVLKEVRFVDEDHLHIRYLSKDDIERTETITINNK